MITKLFATPRRLNIAPRPYSDETLSSWFGRVANENGLPARTLLRCINAWFPRFTARTIGNACAPENLKMLETLLWLEFGELSKRNLNGDWVVRSLPRACCTECLGEDLEHSRIPYDRCAWHSPYAIACKVHKIPLMSWNENSSGSTCPAQIVRSNTSGADSFCISLQEILSRSGTFTRNSLYTALSGVMKPLYEQVSKASGDQGGSWLRLFDDLGVREVVALPTPHDFLERWQRGSKTFSNIRAIATVEGRRALWLGATLFTYLYCTGKIECLQRYLSPKSVVMVEDTVSPIKDHLFFRFRRIVEGWPLAGECLKNGRF